MNRSIRSCDRPLRLAVLSVVVFSLLAHGYRYLSMGFTGDALQISQAGEAVYQATLGRFLQPVYWLVRGHITAPLTIGLFATAFLCASAALIVRLLGLTQPLHIALCCALLATCETMALSAASYLPWLDVYMLALLFAVLGVYVSVRIRRSWLLSPVLYCLSLGLYQSYLPAASTLILILLLLDTLHGARVREIWRRGLLACLSLLLGLLLYAAVLRAVLALLGAQASQDYNGVGRVGLIALDTLPALLRDTYVTPMKVFFSTAFTWHDSAVPALLNAGVFALCAVLLLHAGRAMTAGAWLTSAFLLFMLPLGMNFIQFISRGIASGLTIYAYTLAYLLPLALCARLRDARGLVRWVRRAAAALLCTLTLVNIVNANQMYIKRDLEYASTLSAMTRIIGRMEQTPGYVPGETPVVLLGVLSSSAIAMERPGFEDIARVQGMRYVYGPSHESAAYWYLQTTLGVPVNLVSLSERLALAQTQAALGVPAFPAQDCCQMIDGMLYVRIN